MTIIRNVPRANYSATTAPGVTNDITEGYVVGSKWADTTADIDYVCLDNTDGAAVWIQTEVIDIVQASDSVIATNDTLVLTFAFVPSEIVINYSSRLVHDTTSEQGHTTGQCLITITGTDTFTSNLNQTTIRDASAAIATDKVQNDTTNVISSTGGHDGTNSATLLGVGSWNTGNKQLTITFTAANATDASSFLELMVTAYK